MGKVTIGAKKRSHFPKPHQGAIALIMLGCLYFMHLGLDRFMETTKLSSQGQVIIPKSLRDAHHWEAGIELIASDFDGDYEIYVRRWWQWVKGGVEVMLDLLGFVLNPTYKRGERCLKSLN